jgi:hypothetical protein
MFELADATTVVALALHLNFKTPVARKLSDLGM